MNWQGQSISFLYTHHVEQEFYFMSNRVVELNLFQLQVLKEVKERSIKK